MTAIQKVARQALLTFGARDGSGFAANFERLEAMVSAITSSDISLQKPAKQQRRKNSKSFAAPVSYINICESTYFTLGVFILRSGVSIPLHDHPGMHGICKVLYGSVKVRSYDPILISNGLESEACSNQAITGKKPIKCKLIEEKIYTETSKTCTLSPNSGNYHSIQAHNGQAAFLDILAPPYVTGERDCTYYKECSNEEGNDTSSSDSGSEKWLIEIPQPLDFYCDSMPYEGPSINLDL